MINTLKQLEKYLVVLLLFLLPTQLAFHFWPHWSFVFGIRVDLLSPSLYLTDLLVLALVFLNLNFLKEYKKYFLIILVFAVVNCFFSTSQPVSVYKWLKVVEIAFVAIYFTKQRVLKFVPIITTFFVSSVFISLIGIFQFIKGGTIGGLLYYLGERSFSQGTPGIALVSLEVGNT